MKLWGLFGVVALILHITQQHFLIGPFAKLDTFHWSRCILQYLNQYPHSPDDIQPHILLTHTYSLRISHSSYESLGMCYKRYTTKGKNACIAQPTSSVGVMRYLYQFQLSLHKITIMSTSLYIL